MVANKRSYTYEEVAVITNNFERPLGEGGFGVVYHGNVNDNEQVAVKVLSESSAQGYKQFKAEVFIPQLIMEFCVKHSRVSFKANLVYHYGTLG